MRCQKFAKKKNKFLLILSVCTFSLHLQVTTFQQKLGVVIALENCLLCCLMTEKWGSMSVGGIAAWLSFLSC